MLPLCAGKRLIPQLLGMAEWDPSRILLFGPWSAREDVKRYARYITSSNNPRGFFYFDESVRWVGQPAMYDKLLSGFLG